jgi:hypothetical protein
MAENDCTVTDSSNDLSDRIELAMNAAGQIEVLSNRLLRHTDGVMQEMDTGESATIIRALAGRCSSLAHAAFTLLNAEAEPIRPEDLEAIEKRVTHG